MIIDKDCKRIISYAFYDRDGIVDRYVIYMLEKLLPFCDRLLVSSNGKLEEASYKSLESLGVEIIERPNEGLDITAHREVLEMLGPEVLSSCDEFIMMNDTVMGPVRPLSEMFDAMATYDLDFWGLATHAQGKDGEPYDNKYGYLPQHIQSYFIAIRKNLLSSKDFYEYWETMPQIRSYKDAVCYHETIFTKHFADLGYKWSTYINSEWLDDYVAYQTLWAPKLLIQDFKCPVFKKRVFFNDYFLAVHTSLGNQAVELMDYLKAETEYDTDMIWENLLRVCNMTDIQNNLHLTSVLSADTSTYKKKSAKLALHIDIRNEAAITWCYNKAHAMPSYSDIYISATSDLKELVEKTFTNGPWASVNVVNSNPDKNDVFIPKSLLCQFLNYDYVCSMHDMLDTPYEEHMHIVEYEYIDRCYDNLLGSSALVRNILANFDANPKLGIITAPEAYHGDYYQFLGDEWAGDYNLVKEAMRMTGIRCPISENKLPAVLCNGMFWFRPAAVRTLFEQLAVQNLPLVSGEGTLRSAMDKILPIAAQAEGFYTSNVLSDRCVAAELTNLRYMVQHINTAIADKYEIGSQYSLILLMKSPYAKYLIKRKVRETIGDDNWVKWRDKYHKSGGTRWLG